MSMRIPQENISNPAQTKKCRRSVVNPFLMKFPDVEVEGPSGEAPDVQSSGLGRTQP